VSGGEKPSSARGRGWCEKRREASTEFRSGEFEWMAVCTTVLFHIRVLCQGLGVLYSRDTALLQNYAFAMLPSVLRFRFPNSLLWE
jgi:hypothetical protein